MGYCRADLLRGLKNGAKDLVSAFIDVDSEKVTARAGHYCPYGLAGSRMLGLGNEGGRMTYAH
jgi:hypothetical protein